MKNLKKEILKLRKEYQNVPEEKIETTKSGIPVFTNLENQTMNKCNAIIDKASELLSAKIGRELRWIEVNNLMIAKTEEIFEERFNKITNKI